MLGIDNLVMVMVVIVIYNITNNFDLVIIIYRLIVNIVIKEFNIVINFIKIIKVTILFQFHSLFFLTNRLLAQITQILNKFTDSSFYYCYYYYYGY